MSDDPGPRPQLQEVIERLMKAGWIKRGYHDAEDVEVTYTRDGLDKATMLYDLLAELGFYGTEQHASVTGDLHVALESILTATVEKASEDL